MNALHQTLPYQLAGNWGPFRKSQNVQLNDACIDLDTATEPLPLTGRNNVLFGGIGLTLMAGLALALRPRLPGAAALGAGALYFGTIHMVPGALDKSHKQGGR